MHPNIFSQIQINPKMEISHVLGHRVQSIFFSISSLSFSTRPIIQDSQSSSAISVTTNNTKTIRTKSQNSPLYKSSSKAKQSAILGIQQSPDLNLALSRPGGVVKVQDLDIVMCDFEKNNRLTELSQVFLN